MPSSRLHVIVPVALVLAGAVLLPVLAHEGHIKAAGNAFDPNAPRKPSAQTAAAIGLQTAEVGFGPIEEIVRLGGLVRARPEKRIAIGAPVEGTLSEMSLQPGDRVKRGDVVATIHSPQFAQMFADQLKSEVEYEHAQSEVVTTSAGLKTLAGQIAAAEEQARIADQEVARLQIGADAVSANALSQRQGAAIQARSQVEALKATLAQQTRELESLTRRANAAGEASAALRNVLRVVQTGPFGLAAAGSGGAEPADPVGVLRLRSPIDGVVVSRTAVVGQGAVAGHTLLEVADFDKVQIDGELPESLTDRMGPGGGSGAAVRIRRVTDGPIIGAGVVRGLSPVIDPIKRTSHLVVDADNAPSASGGGGGGGVLRDGMYVDLSIVVRAEKSAVVVPSSAVVSDGPLQFVFIKDHDTFTKRDVRLGARDDRSIEVLGGLIPGDVIAIRGAYALSQLRPDASADAHDHEHDHEHEDHDHAH